MSRMNLSVRTYTARFLTICCVHKFVTWFIGVVIFSQSASTSLDCISTQNLLDFKSSNVNSPFLEQPVNDSGSFFGSHHATRSKVIHFELRSFSCFIFSCLLSSRKSLQPVIIRECMCITEVKTYQWPSITLNGKDNIRKRISTSTYFH